jgi:predicted double-glycine peptidase
LTPAIAVRVLAAAVTLVTAAAPVSAQSASPPIPLLDVPYVAQSEALCGGAAVAMVMRYWGATRIYAESFAALVDPRGNGIRGEDLIASLTRRGWNARSFRGDAGLVTQSLETRRPPIALIEDRPGRFHYVVIVSWVGGKVVVHDPARQPFQVRDERVFLDVWAKSGYWTLLALPPAAAPRTEAAAGNPSTPTPGICGSAVDRAVDLANTGRVDEARHALEAAAAQCPREAAPWRELAGVRVLQKDWPRAAADARAALAIEPADEHAARTLATSLYLAGDSPGALRAWNAVEEPVVDLIEVRGLERTRFAVALHTLRLPTQTLLTPDRLTRAARRLDSLPSALGSSVTYTPRDEGLALVTAAVIERPLLPSTPMAAGAMAVRAATDREVQLEIVSATGGGERWFAAWRWWEARPRLAVGLEAPAPFGGTWQVSAADEHESYGSAAATFQERRRTLSVGAADWLTASVKWEVGVLAERWPTGSGAGAIAALRYQASDDRFMAGGRAGVWSIGTDAWTAGLFADFRSRTRAFGTVWLGRAGLDLAGAGTPLQLWPGAGTGQGRSALLRAHPLLHDGAIRDAVFGRTVVSAGAEWRRWGPPVLRVLRVAPAAFVDVARASQAPPFADSRAHLDVGVGVRVAVPGAGVLRADLARGLRDGEMALSFGWTR